MGPSDQLFHHPGTRFIATVVAAAAAVSMASVASPPFARALRILIRIAVLTFQAGLRD
jgi:hypothetical protein